MIQLLFAAALASEPQDFRSHLDQARFFLRKEWYGDALEELEKAVATEDGRLDPEAWFLLAKVRYELGDLPGARFAADRALVHSRDQNQARQTHELLTFFEQKFGYIEVQGAPGTQAQLVLTLESTLFDPELKRWVNRVIESLEEPVTLPHELGLPAAKYRINGTEVEVVAGSKQAVSPEVELAREPALQAVRLEVGAGAVGALGARTSNLLPAPTTDVGVVVPVGPVVAGIGASWTVQPYQTRDDAVVTSLGVFGVGARLGVALPVGRLDVRPSATWRVGSFPGVEVGCAESAATWTCDGAPTANEELFVYTAAMAHALGLELAAVTRPTPIGFGLKAAGELVLGSLPRGGDAVGPDGPLGFTVEGPRGIQAGGWRMLAVMQVRPVGGG